MTGNGASPAELGRAVPTEHLPLRPLWLCRRCGQPWPCGQARLALIAEYRANAIGLFLHMAGRLYEAIDDLHRLNPSATGDATDLFDRFLGWPVRHHGGARSTTPP